MSGADGARVARARLVAAIEREVRETAAYTGIEAMAEEVIDSVGTVPRERFVPPEQVGAAYVDTPLPIGYRQTISQPFIVALMTHLLRPHLTDVMLEIGTGSGYQAAVLSPLLRRLYSVEVVPELAQRAARTLASLGCENVEVKHGDGRSGWLEHAPYQGIIVTAAADAVPETLLEQLDIGGRLVIPIGGPGRQELVRLTKRGDGALDTDRVLPVAFVPLVYASS